MNELKEEIAKKMERAETAERMCFGGVGSDYYRGQYSAYKMVLLMIESRMEKTNAN